jgi:hypothetical protein
MKENDPTISKRIYLQSVEIRLVGLEKTHIYNFIQNNFFIRFFHGMNFYSQVSLLSGLINSQSEA